MSIDTTETKGQTTKRVGHPRRWTILALVLAAECMDLLDGTIVNVAAPTIHSDLGAGTAALQWIIGGYALAFAIGLIAGGRLGDIYGRKRLFVLGALGFVASSVACAFASSPEMLIGFRLAQGAAAALLIPQGLGIIRDVFAPEELPRAFTVFGPVIGLSAVLGPILGGALIAADAFGSGWRLIFFINLPLGLIAAIGAARVMPESRAPRRPNLDLVGTGLAALGMGLLIYPLIQGPRGRVAGVDVSDDRRQRERRSGCWPLWSRRERGRGRDPLIESSIFQHRSYSTGLATILVFFAGMIGTLLVITLFLQLGEHFSAIHAGVTLAPFAFGIGDRRGARRSAARALASAGPCSRSRAWCSPEASGGFARRCCHGRPAHELAVAGRPAAGRRDRHRDAGLAAVRLRPGIGSPTTKSGRHPASSTPSSSSPEPSASPRSARCSSPRSSTRASCRPSAARCWSSSRPRRCCSR